MKVSQLIFNKEYGIKGQPGKKFLYKGQEGKRFWFKGPKHSFWMKEDQVETLLTDV